MSGSTASPRPPSHSGRRSAWSLLGLLVALGWSSLLVGHGGSIADVHNDLLVIAFEWTVVGILLVIGFGVERRRPGFFGLQRPGRVDLLAMVGAYVGTYVVMAVAGRFLTIQTSMLDLRAVATVPVAVKVVLVVTAAVCEEFMFRGFAIEELVEWSGSLPVAAVVTWLAFVAAHVGRYGLTTGLVIPAIAGGALTLLYAWRRNLPVCMLVHGAMDGLTIFLAPVLLKAHGG